MGARLRPWTRGVHRDRDAEDLARALNAGDARAAWPLLIDRYRVTVYRYCRQMLGNDADGDDVSQVVFLQAFEAIQRRSRIGHMHAYLLGIARHRCLDRLEVRRRFRSALDADELEEMPESEDPGDGEARERRICQALEDCLGELDSRSRMVVLFRFRDDLTYKQIGQLTGDQPGALRVRVSRALCMLRRSLERRGIAP